MPDLLRFGPFNFSPVGGDLFKGRTRLRLQQHPSTILVMLLERPGELVTRDEIRKGLWPNGTIVEFDHSINTAVNKLRSALSDSAEKPRYIETVARKGYRFVAPVTRGNAIDQQSKAVTEGQRFPSGAVVSHYRIERPVGSGANGQVYQALDLNLERRVALKFLTDSGSDENARQRFHGEARAISALDHPNVCGVYEFEEHAGSHFLALQFLEGETLAHRIRREGPLDRAYLLQVALGVASGMEAAHDRGIIHCDIKPANIFLTSSGQVKILDFGVARFGAAVTLTGGVSGTAPYMSPEQLRGEEVDHRTDIYSFGLVLYEMAAGGLRQPSCPNPELTPKLASLIDGTLAKDRKERISSFSAVREALKEIAREAEQSAAVKPAHYLLKLAVLVLIVAAGVASSILSSRRPLLAPNLKITPVTSSPGLKEHVRLSPDDSRIAFAWYSENHNEDIFVQELGAQTLVRLTSDPARDYSPAWSHDGKHIAFARNQLGNAGLYIVGSSGGTETKMGEFRANPAPFCRALDWSPDGKHLAMVEWRPQTEGGPALFLISAADGTKVRRLLSSKGDFLCAPAFSPDGSLVAVVEGPDFRVSDVHIVPVAGGAERRVTFERRMMQGLSWTADSTSIAYSSRRSGPFGLWQIAVTGGEPRTLVETGNDVADPDLSRKGRRLVFVRDMWDTNIWRVEGPESEGPRSEPMRLIAATREDSAPDVSPDGEQPGVHLSAHRRL